jgi:hypothetical protein
MTHQDLLEVAVRGSLSRISEFSGNMQRDYRGVRKWALAYANAHGLKPPPINLDDYIFDEDEDS